MKSIHLILVVFLFSFTFHAQIIDIPDANFKNALVNTNCVDTDNNGIPDADADTNDDGEISVPEAFASTNLSLFNQSISSLESIENFVNLTRLRCPTNQLTSINVSSLVNLTSLDCPNNQLTEIIGIENLTNLTYLGCQNNQLTQLNLNGLTNMESITCFSNQLVTLIIGNMPNLVYMDCGFNQLTSIDLSGAQYMLDIFVYNNQLTFLDLSDRIAFGYTRAQNNQIETLILKNGMMDIVNMDFQDYEEFFHLENNPISYVCADDGELDELEGILELQNINNFAIGTYCSFEPGGEFYSVEGTTKIDFDTNGCDSNDSNFSSLLYNVTNLNETFNYIVDNSGDFSIPFLDGEYTITPTLENPNYFSVIPSSITVNFPTDSSPFMQDFCITPNGTYNDLEITIIPIDEARPGFEADYKIVYKNKGTTTLSGDIDFGFQDTIMDYVTATPPNESGLSDLLSWSFSDLIPFESREILLTMNINSPMDTPPVNGDDVLSYTTTISSSEFDETPEDNTFQLNQTVVNSFDPNDKTCLEGDTIEPEQVGEFVHYRIRFENTGTANAINVVVKDNIDRASYDLSTLVPLDASHEFVARIKDDASDYYVEFIFEDINLPFDDANNDGYVVFKIRTLDTLQLNYTFQNEAEIYFDFNFPIITNLAQTTVATLSTEDFSLANNNIVLYPNPTTNLLHLDSNQAIKHISIYDISGRQIQEIAMIGSQSTVELSTEALSAGTFFVKIKTSNSDTVKKFIKK